MSLVTIIRDYVDVANSSEQLDGYTFSSLAYYTLGFLFSILKQVIVNFCTFQWIRDFSYFCLTPPMLFSSFANINISEGTDASLHQSLSNLVAFSETHFLSGIGLIFLGFFNGCFTSIHISAANLITIQRLLVNGVPAGLCSALGTAIGQCFFLASVHFGFRTLLFPWLSIEPLPFLLGLGILFAIASNSAQDRRTPTIQWSAKSYLLTYIFTSVALAWCEQTALFQLMGNLSFGAEPTLLETTPGTIFNAYSLGVALIGIIKNGSYLLAFFFGNFLGTFFLAYALQRLLELLLSFKGIPIYYGLIKQANLPLATLIFAFGFGSLPYYGVDYLITKGFGFIPQEQLFQQTLFSPVNLVSKTSQSKEPNQGRFEDQLALLFTLEGEKKKSFVVDTTPFDDGQYLKTGQKRPQAFEDLNYRGEHLWTTRLARISSIKEQANPTQSSFLGPAFSWMRSFLWGEGPTHRETGSNVNREAYANTNVTPSGSALESFNNFNNAYLEEENFRRKKELSVEGEQLDNYVTEFERQFDKGFSNFHNAKPISLIEVEDQWQEQRIKKKCYTNPIYKFLLNIEIDSFLGRQPNYHRLSAEEEILLLKRRQLLSDYYDTLVLTSQIPLSQAFDQLVPKSYTNTVYNHQFKGTLKIARRLFSIKSTPPMLQASKSNFSASSSRTPRGYALASSNFSLLVERGKGIDLSNSNEKLEEDSLLQQQEGLLEKEKSRILKFDQPLFSKEKILSNSVNSQLQNSDFVDVSLPERSEITEQELQRNNEIIVSTNCDNERIIFHEELNCDSKENKPEYVANPRGGMRLSKTTDSSVSQAPQDVGVTKGAQTNSRLQKSTDKNIFLLEQAESLPLYASWDEELRKLILTNRFQSRIKAGYTAGQDFLMQSQGSTLVPVGEKDSHITRSLDSNISFTAWPLPNPLNEYVIPYSKSKSNPPAIATVSPSHTSLKSETLQENTTLVKRNGKNNDSFKNNVQKATQLGNQKGVHSWGRGASDIFKFVKNLVDSLIHTTFHVPSFLFPTQSIQSFNYNKETAPNDMINALLQWQKLIKDNKQLSKEDKQAAKEKVSYWPKNVRRANWSTELMDNDIEFDEPAENALRSAKKQKILWEFIPPNYGGFIWPGIK